MDPDHPFRDREKCPGGWRSNDWSCYVDLRIALWSLIRNLRGDAGDMLSLLTGLKGECGMRGGMRRQQLDNRQS